MQSRLEGGLSQKVGAYAGASHSDSLIFLTWEVRVLFEGDHSSRVDKVRQETISNSPPFPRAVLKDVGS